MKCNKDSTTSRSFYQITVFFLEKIEKLFFQDIKNFFDGFIEIFINV